MALFVWGPVAQLELEAIGDRKDGAVPELFSKAGRQISPEQTHPAVRAVIDVIETPGSIVSLDLRFEPLHCTAALMHDSVALFEKSSRKMMRKEKCRFLVSAAVIFTAPLLRQDARGAKPGGGH